MQSVLVLSAITAVSAGGSLAITWEDCGDASTHGKVTAVTPDTLVLGETTTITSSGSLDKEISGGTFDIGVKAGGGLVNKHYTGNSCEAKTFSMPLGMGSMTWSGLPCPVAAGSMSFGLEVQLAGVLPAAIATADIQATAIDQDGEPSVCTSVHAQKAFETIEADNGCSGTADFVETPACYGNNVLGQEDVTMQIESFAGGAGRLSVTGTGATPLSCETAFSKDGSNKITIEDCDVSSYATIKGAQYCSDTDELKATFNPLGVPIPVTVKFPRRDCGGEVSI